MTRQSATPAPPAQPPSDDARRRRLAYRAAHRGTYENDLLIGGYVARHLTRFDTAELDALEAILELPDPALADWLTGRAPIPPEHDQPILRAMREEAEAGLSR